MKTIVGGCWLVLVLWMIPSQATNACTVFAVSHDGVVLFGNNEDWKDPYTRVWFLPPENSKYGRIYLGFDRFGVTNPQGGMNDQGLAFDILAGPPHRLKGDPQKERYRGNLPVQAMEECSSVEEVIVLFDRYSHEGTWNGQYFFADKSGAAVIIEGDVIHRKKGRFQVATNFYLSQATSARYPCSRHNRATEMLTKDGPATVDLSRRVLAAVMQEGVTPTLYSNIFDLKKGIMHLYHFHDFEHAVTMALQTELRKGRRTIALASLFPAAAPVHVRGSSIKEPVSRMMMPVIEKQGVAEAIKRFRSLSASEEARYDCSERVLNMLGIELGRAGRFEAAVGVLRFVVEDHPRSANAYDSLAWAYMKSGQVELAISNYETSLRLNPKNANAAKRLEELRRQ